MLQARVQVHVEVRVSTEESQGSRMEVRERMGTSVRTMVNVATEVWERGGRRRVCEDEGLETAWSPPAL